MAFMRTYEVEMTLVTLNVKGKGKGRVIPVLN